MTPLPDAEAYRRGLARLSGPDPEKKPSIGDRFRSLLNVGRNFNRQTRDVSKGFADQAVNIHAPRTGAGVAGTLADISAAGRRAFQRPPSSARPGELPQDIPSPQPGIPERALRGVSEEGFRQSDEAQERAFEGDPSTSTKVGRVLGELIPTGAEFIAGGGVARRFVPGLGPTAATGGRRILTEAAKDAAAVAPIDIAATQRPQDSMAGMIEMFLDPEKFPELTQNPEGIKQALLGFGITGLNRVATAANKSRVGRAAFEAVLGGTADVILRSVASGGRAGLEAVSPAARTAADALAKPLTEAVPEGLDVPKLDAPTRPPPEPRAELPPDAPTRGEAEPRAVNALARGGAGATVGAALDEDNRARGALAGATLSIGAPQIFSAIRGLDRTGAVPIKGKMFSRLERAIEAAPQERAPASQWAGMIRKAQGGVSRGEIEFTGVEKLLAEDPNRIFTKAELLQHLEGSGIRLEETTRGAIEAEAGLNPNSKFMGPEVRRVITNAQDVRLELANDGDAYRELTSRFPELVEDEDWVETVLGSVFPPGGRLEVPSPKFESYTQPGGENYREVLVQLDKGEPTAKPFEPATELPPGFEPIHDFHQPEGQRYSVIPPGQQHARPYEQGVGYATPEEAMQGALNHYNRQAKSRLFGENERARSASQFTQGHFDEPNVLVHLRMTDRTVGNEKVLFVEEIQSDWMQKGRKQGFFRAAAGEEPAESAFAFLRNRGHDVTELTLERAEREARELGWSGGVVGRVPDAPFKGTSEWVELGMRRVITEAVEGGYDRVAWVSGKQSADLYDLRKQVSEIEYSDHNQQLIARDLNGEIVIDELPVPPEKLPDFIGKEPARRLLEQSPEEAQRSAAGIIRSISGEDLAVGGEGMLDFYDKIVPRTLSKLGKTIGGVEVQPVRIVDPKEQSTFGPPTNLGFAITPAMRDIVTNQGQRLGFALPELTGTIARAGAGAVVGGAAGAGVAGATDTDIGTGTLLGITAGLGLGAIAGRAKPRGARVTGEVAEEVGEAAGRAAGAEAAAEAAARPPRFTGDVDPEEFIGRIGKFQADPEGEVAILEAAEEVARTRGQAPKQVITHEESRSIARVFGQDPQEFTQRILAKEGGLDHAEIIATRDVVKNNLRLIRELEKEIHTGTSDGRAMDAQELSTKTALLEAIENQTDNLIERFEKNRSEAGRSLSAHRALANDTLDPLVWMGRFRRKMGMDVPADLRAEIDKLIEVGDQEGLALLAGSLEKSPIQDQMLALWKAGLLTAPTTHQVNIVSTAANLALEGAKDPVAAGLDRMLRGVAQLAAGSGAKLRGDDAIRIGRTKATPGLRATATGARRGLKDMSLAMQGRSTGIEAARRWDYKNTNIDLVPSIMGGKVFNPILDGYQKMVFRTLGAEDKFFKAVRVEQSIHDQARVVALNEGAKNPVTRANQLYAEWKANGYEKLPDAVAMQAVSDGEVATFTDRSLLARMASKMKRAAQEGARQPNADLVSRLASGLTEFVAPFTGTPSNVVSRVAEYSGGGLVTGGFDAVQVIKAAFEGTTIPEVQRRAVETMARGAVGVSVMLPVGYMLYQSGDMKLNRERSGGQQGASEIAGSQEFSILRNGKWHSLERTSPVGNVLIAGGYIARAVERLETDPEASALNVIAEPAAGIGAMVMSQSFMQGTSDFLKAIIEEEDPESSAGDRYLRRQAGSIVPNIVKRVANAMDTNAEGKVNVRMTDNWLDAIQYGLPRLREALPLRRDPLGKGLTRKTAGAEFFDLTYARESQTERSPLRAELSRLKAPFPKRQRDRAGGEESEAFSRRIRDEGRDLQESLTGLIRSDPYRSGTLEQARNMARSPPQVREIADALKRELIAETIRATRRRFTAERAN